MELSSCKIKKFIIYPQKVFSYTSGTFLKTSFISADNFPSSE